MQRRTLILAFLLLPVAAFAAEPLSMSFEIHGRTPLHVEPVDGPGYGILGAAVYVGEPLIATVAALHTSPGDVAAWAKHLEWTVTNDAGDPVAISVDREFDAPIHAPHHLRLRSDVGFANFRFDTLPPGRYFVALAWTDPITGAKGTASRRRLAIYRGNETPRVRSVFLREQARAVLREGTPESYAKARAMLLEAAQDNSDPSVYEELADASAPWAAPDETATYYQRSLDVATKNLEKHHGARKDWPAKARQLYEPRARKVQAFQELVPYYKNSFSAVRIRVVREDATDKFVIERRSDGNRLRVIDPQQQRSR